MERLVYRTSLRQKIKVIVILFVVLALIFVGCYFLGGVKDFSWLYLLPVVFLYTILSERYILTDNQLLVCSGFFGKYQIDLSKIVSISNIKNGFMIEYIKSNNKKSTLSIFKIANQQQMIDEIQKRVTLDSNSNI